MEKVMVEVKAGEGREREGDTIREGRGERYQEGGENNNREVRG